MPKSQDHMARVEGGLPLFSLISYHNILPKICSEGIWIEEKSSAIKLYLEFFESCVTS